MGNLPRNTTIRDRHRATIRASKPPCGICGGEIDYTLKHTDPGSFVVDHIIPWARSHDDSLDNKQAAHRACNREKSDKVEGDDDINHGPREFETARTW